MQRVFPFTLDPERLRGMASELAAFLRLAAPMVISRAGIAGMTITDGIMVARRGSVDLAVLGLSEGTIGRLLDVLVALIAAGMVLAANAHASGSAQEAGAVWRRAMSASMITGLVAAVVGACGLWWLPVFGESPALTGAAVPVVATLGAGMPAALVAIATAMFLEAVGRPNIVAVAIIAANILNIVLNWLLIDGGLGIPALGALGCALSSTGVRVVLAGVLVFYAATLPDQAVCGVSVRLAARSGAGALQRRLGYSAAATAAVMNALVMCLTVLAGWLGALQLAAIVALWNALSIGMLLALGIADATAIRVAAAYGRASFVEARADGWLGLQVALIALVLLALPMIAAPEILAAVYAPHGALGDTLALLLPVGAVILICDGAGIVCAGALRGVGEAAWPAAIQIASGMVLVPLAWWLAIYRDDGAPGLVLAILLISVVRMALLAMRFFYCAEPSRLSLAPTLS